MEGRWGGGIQEAGGDFVRWFFSFPEHYRKKLHMEKGSRGRAETSGGIFLKHSWTYQCSAFGCDPAVISIFTQYCDFMYSSVLLQVHTKDQVPRIISFIFETVHIYENNLYRKKKLFNQCLAVCTANWTVPPSLLHSHSGELVSQWEGGKELCLTNQGGELMLMLPSFAPSGGGLRKVNLTDFLLALG